MSGNEGNRTLATVLQGLVDERLTGAERAATARALLERPQDEQPWYVRAMIGTGAWLASLLLIGFVAGFGIAVGGNMLIGVALVVGALLVRRRWQHDFAVQAALSTSLAGQALFTWGFADLTGNDEEVLCLAVIAVSTLLFFVFPDRIHRVLMVLFAALSLVVLVYLYEANALIPFLGPAFAAGLVAVDRHRAAFAAGGRYPLLRPLRSGLMLSAFGCLMLSTVYLLPELDLDFRFYPRPWISTVLLGALLLYLSSRIWPPLLAGSGPAAAATVHGLTIVVIAAAWAAPGLILALIVTLSGARSGNRAFIGAGIAFLAVFLGAYFYGIEVTLLTKSLVLITSGVVLFLAAALLMRILPAPAGVETDG